MPKDKTKILESVCLVTIQIEIMRAQIVQSKTSKLVWVISVSSRRDQEDNEEMKRSQMKKEKVVLKQRIDGKMTTKMIRT